jgi:mannose-6-phosphate isomerase
MPETGDGTRHTLVQCDYFTLEMLSAESNIIELDTNGETFHAITVIEGGAILQTETISVELARFQTAVVPSEMRRYQFQPLTNCRALKSSV